MKPLSFLVALSLVAGCVASPPQETAKAQTSAKPLGLKGILVALNKAENSASLIDLTTLKEYKRVKTGIGPNEVMVSPNGKVAVISNMGTGPQPDRTITVVNLPSGDIARTIDLGKNGRPHGMVWLDDNRILVTCHETDNVVRVNVTEGKVEHEMPSGGKGTHLILLSPDKKRAYTVNVMTKDVSVIDLEKPTLVKTIACDTRAEGMSLSPDGKTLSVGNVGANNVSVIDTAKLEVVKTLTNTMAPIRTIYTPDGKHMIVSAAGSGELVVFDAKTHEEKKRIKVADGSVKFTLGAQGPQHGIPMNWSVHHDGKHLFVAVINANAIAILDGQTLEIVGKADTGQLPDGIAISPIKA